VPGRTGDTTGCDHDRKTNHQQLPGDHDSVRHFLSLLLSVRPIVCLFISLSVCMHQQVCVELPTSPVNVALPAFAAARRAAAPVRQTDGRTLYRYIYPAPHTMRAVPITSADGFTNTGAMLAFISFPFIEN